MTKQTRRRFSPEYKEQSVARLLEPGPEHAIRFMCRVLGVAHSWFHARRRAAPKRAERAARRDRLGSEIREIFEQSKRCYGAPRIHAELKARGRAPMRRHAGIGSAPPHGID